MSTSPESRHAFAPLTALLVSVMAVVLLGRRTEVLRDIELKTYDWRCRALSAPSRHDPRLVLVTIDQASLDHFEKDATYWPWPRSIYVPLLEFLKKGGAKAVVFDLLFSSPSTLDAAQDSEFGRALQSFGPTALAVETSAGADPLRAKRPPERFAAEAGAELTASAPARRSMRLPVPDLMAGTRLIGDTSMVPDADGVMRRVPLATKVDGKLYPTLPAATAMLATGKTLEKLRPPMTDGRMLVRFHGKALTADPRLKTYDAYQIGDLIVSWSNMAEGKPAIVDPALFKGAVVIVAGSAAGLLDNRPSPISPVYPGTETVAAAADNLINRDFMTSAPAWTAWALVLAALLAAFAATRLAARTWLSACVMLVTTAALAAAACLAFRHGVWLEMVAPQLSLWLGYAGLSAYGYAVEGRQKRYIQGAFSHYLSPVVVRQIAESPEKLALGGERRDVTVYFSDIQGFTSFSEKLEPEKLTQLMNRYLSEMTETILASGGTLDKYIGDAIMAFWNAPLSDEDHAVTACKAALANQKRLAELRAEFAKEGYPPVYTRIGLNSGPAIIGNMGSARRFSYTAIGDNVNLASRLEGANKAYGSYILISESTLAGAKDAVEVRELDYVKVKGKNLPIRVYELLGLKGGTDPRLIEKARDFEAGLALFRARKFDEARQAFEQVAKAHGEDHACENYIERCRHYTSEPPPPDWDGSHALTEK